MEEITKTSNINFSGSYGASPSIYEVACIITDDNGNQVSRNKIARITGTKKSGFTVTVNGMKLHYKQASLVEAINAAKRFFLDNCIIHANY
jgi:hypothetical protein